MLMSRLSGFIPKNVRIAYLHGGRYCSYKVKRQIYKCWGGKIEPSHAIWSIPGRMACGLSIWGWRWGIPGGRDAASKVSHSYYFPETLPYNPGFGLSGPWEHYTLHTAQRICRKPCCVCQPHSKLSFPSRQRFTGPSPLRLSGASYLLKKNVSLSFRNLDII